MGRKKLVRKAEPPSKRGIDWPRWTGFRGMTLRDWLPIVGALLIPVVIAFVGLRFTAQLDARQQRLAEQRTQDLTLQAYLDQMSTFVLEDLSDRKVQAVMRARTLTALRRLDASRKAEVMQFLDEADLVRRVDGRQPVISLNGADLSGANLFNTDFTGAKLNEADLRSAELISVELSDASLIFADLRGANLRDADLSDAKMEPADVRDMTQQAAILEGATMPNGQKYEEWLKSRGEGDSGT